MFGGEEFRVAVDPGGQALTVFFQRVIGGAWLWAHWGVQTEEEFFFEKKNQKTFALLGTRSWT
jgi:hypothetical protein